MTKICHYHRKSITFTNLVVPNEKDPKMKFFVSRDISSNKNADENRVSPNGFLKKAERNLVLLKGIDRTQTPRKFLCRLFLNLCLNKVIAVVYLDAPKAAMVLDIPDQEATAEGL